MATMRSLHTSRVRSHVVYQLSMHLLAATISAHDEAHVWGLIARSETGRAHHIERLSVKSSG
eukprot:611880-Amphidinium_carterae.1